MGQARGRRLEPERKAWPVSGVAFKEKKEKEEAEGTHVSSDSAMLGRASKFAARCSPIAK